MRTAENRLLRFGAFAFFRGPAFGNGRNSSGERGVAFSVTDSGRRRRVLDRLLLADVGGAVLGRLLRVTCDNRPRVVCDNLPQDDIS